MGMAFLQGNRQRRYALFKIRYTCGAGGNGCGNLYLSEDFPDGSLNQQIRMGIPGGGSLVNHHQFIAAKIVNQPGGRVHGKRSTPDNQHLCIMYIPHCGIDGFLVKAFFVEDHVRLYGTAALFAFRHTGGIPDIMDIIKLSAFFAVIAQYRAVQLQHCPVSRGLMEPVDVLSDYGGELPRRLPIRSSASFICAALGFASRKSILLR